jgi:ectoine hydroxylase-related dioxygenase (phytanoyl-CoA dioxygenase family)
MALLTRLTSKSTVEDVSEVLDRDGVVVIEDLVDDTTLSGLWADLGPALDDVVYGDNIFSGQRTKRLCSLFARSRHTADVVVNPLFLGAARRQISRPAPEWFSTNLAGVAPNVQVSSTQVIQIRPGESAQPAHRDDVAHLLRTTGHPSRVQIMVALDDFTADNGATVFWPGSHRWEPERDPRPNEAAAAEMTPGSAVLWVGGLLHGAGANLTEEARTGLTIALTRANLRQEENQYLAVPPEIVREYPEEVQRLLGYDLCPPFLGWYEHHDPRSVLEQPRV